MAFLFRSNTKIMTPERSDKQDFIKILNLCFQNVMASDWGGKTDKNKTLKLYMI